MDSFWKHIEQQLDELRTAKTADDVIRILDEPSSGDAFFAGSGGDQSIAESLYEAGWVTTWIEAHYYWVMRAPNGDLITYVEGDVYRGDTHQRVSFVIHSIGGRSETVTGTVMGMKRGQLIVKTESGHGTVCVPVDRATPVNI